VLMAHHGSWDVGARWVESHGYHFVVVTEEVRPRRLFARFTRLREAMGVEVVPLRRGGRRPKASAAPLVAALSANHVVGLVADRAVGGSAAPVTLFGAPTRVPRGPAALATATGAALVPATMLQRPGRRWHLQVLPEVDLRDLPPDAATQAVTTAIEDLVRLDPSQWHAAFSPLWEPAG
jgi:lauroyl/myristoyl acyltransferase